MIDYTRLRKKLTPQPEIGGDPGVRIRTATVAAVNSDGTVDLTMSDGTEVPDVSRLNSAIAYVGAVVQVATFRGAMLVLGSTAPGPGGALIKTGSLTTGPSAATSFSTPVSFGVTFPAIPAVMVGIAGSSPGSTSGWIFRALNVTTTGFDLFGSGSSSTFSQPFQWTATYAP